MTGISSWAAAAGYELADTGLPVIYSITGGQFTFEVQCTHDSLWITASYPKGGKIAFRAAFAPGGNLTIKHSEEGEQEVVFWLSSVTGEIKVSIKLYSGGQHPILNYTTHLKPRVDLLIPFWPRDVVITTKDGKPENTAGQIHTSQVGTRSGLIYLSLTRPNAGSILYMQNLTALADYCQQTETSCGDVVGGQWPELGFALPLTKDKPLAAGREVVISDAFVAFDMEVPDDEPAMVRQYLNLLADVYLQLPRPDTHYSDWPATLDKGLNDMINNVGCWARVKGHDYLNAYVCDYATPPEIMVQLAVLLPLDDYAEWSGREMEVMGKIKEGLKSFYNDELKTIMRWLPAAEDKLEGEEEQKKPMVMDSWYLHHPLLNLSRLALKGDKDAEKLFMGSVDFAIKVAHHFDYQWPVFYKMDTLEVVKAETQPGKGGEKDVPGLYAHIMLQAYELTGKQRFLREAEKSAKKLQGLGFNLFYQANNTTFSAGAMLRLWKITKNQLYLNLSYLCIANVFKNVRLWDCNYGYGRNFPSFFALFPLNDAPYTAVYEEQEVFCALHDYLRHAEGEDILPSVSLLAAEYIRYLVDRAVYYYPPMLPKEMLSDEVKIGEVDPNLWIALEDMHDGWEKCGSVGQEVYGAGNAFGILPRHYYRVPGEAFLIYTDYPTANFTAKKGKPVSFVIKGDNRINCRMMIVQQGEKKLPAFKVTLHDNKEIKGKPVKGGHLEYILSGDQQVKIKW